MGVYGNEEFKALVEQHGFAGLEFVWAQDKGFCDAPQWYWLNLTHWLGRGLDYECFDATKWHPHASEASPEWRCGKTWFDKSQLKHTAPFSSEVKNRFVSLFPESGTDQLRFRAYRRYVNRFLPNTDFAYGREGRASFFCFNRKVRDALVEHNFVTPDECMPIMTLDSPPAGSELLDDSGIPLPRYCLMFEEDELKQIKSSAVAAQQAFAARSKPKREAILEEVLKQLRDESRNDPGRFHAGASKAQIIDASRTLPEELPKAWGEILKVANGFTFEMGDPFEVVSSGDLAMYNKDTQVGAKAGNPDFPDLLIHVSHAFNGDFHSLDLCSVTSAGECRVIEFDHETLQPRREWPSIALFIQEVLRN